MPTKFMTDSEICMFYRQAAWKYEQIGILADLNACDRQVIKDILKEHGLYDPKHPPKRKPTDFKSNRSELNNEPKPKSIMPRGTQKAPGVRRTPEEQDRDYRPLYDQGLNDRQIADRLGMGTGAIAVWRQKRGLPSNIPKPTKKNKSSGGV